MGEPTYFQDDAATTLREGEVPAASFDNGMNLGGACACGIGINMNEGAVVGTPEQFTLLDQRAIARVPQISQSLGGYPYAAPADYPLSGGTEGFDPEGAVRFGDNPTQAAKDADSALDGTITPIANSTLNSLAEGWVASV
jgi:hypothetical protein